jgi:hypothetical protein
MKKVWLCFLALCFYCTLSGQDYVITWANDTIPCSFPEKPGKMGFRPARNYENGHVRVLAIFPGDSIRALEAGQVKAYYRLKHGKELLCNGYFEAKKVKDSDWYRDDAIQRKKGEAWYFMNRVVVGKYASLHMVYIFRGSKAPLPIYFVSKYNDPDPLQPALISTRKRLVELFSDPDIKEAMQPVLQRKARKRYADIVREYNRLKEAAALKLK